MDFLQTSRPWVRSGLIVVFTCGSFISALAGNSFSPQTRVGYTTGDQWEPSIAADGYRHVYVLYPQYGTVPGCSSCPSPTMILVISNDNGKTWQPPKQIASPGSLDLGEFRHCLTAPRKRFLNLDNLSISASTR